MERFLEQRPASGPYRCEIVTVENADGTLQVGTERNLQRDGEVEVTADRAPLPGLVSHLDVNHSHTGLERTVQDFIWFVQPRSFRSIFWDKMCRYHSCVAPFCRRSPWWLVVYKVLIHFYILFCWSFVAVCTVGMVHEAFTPLVGSPTIYWQTCLAACLSMTVAFFIMVITNANLWTAPLEDTPYEARFFFLFYFVAGGIGSGALGLMCAFAVRLTACFSSTICQSVDLLQFEKSCASCDDPKPWTFESCSGFRVKHQLPAIVPRECQFANDTSSCLCVWNHYGQVVWVVTPLAVYLFHCLVVQPMLLAIGAAVVYARQRRRHLSVTFSVTSTGVNE